MSRYINKARQAEIQAANLDDRDRWLAFWFTLSGETLDGLIAELIEGQRTDPVPGLGIPAYIAIRVGKLVVDERQMHPDNALRISRAIQSLAMTPEVTSHHPASRHRVAANPQAELFS